MEPSGARLRIEGVLYFDLESGLPFQADVVWRYLTNPETYTLWLEGLVAVEPLTPLARATDISLSISTQGRTRRITFDVTALQPPTDEAGHLAFEARVSGDLLLGTIRVHRTVGGSRVTVNLELSQGNTFLSVFDKPFGLAVTGREQTLQARLERASVLFRNVLEVHAADPYRGRA